MQKLDFIISKLNMKNIFYSINKEINFQILKRENSCRKKSFNLHLEQIGSAQNMMCNINMGNLNLNSNTNQANDSFDVNKLKSPDNFLNKKFFQEDKTPKTNTNKNQMRQKNQKNSQQESTNNFRNKPNKSDAEGKKFYSQNETENKGNKIVRINKIINPNIAVAHTERNNHNVHTEYNKERASLNSSSGADNQALKHSGNNTSRGKDERGRSQKIKGFNFKNKIDLVNSSFKSRKSSNDDTQNNTLNNFGFSNYNASLPNNNLGDANQNILDNLESKPQIINDKNKTKSIKDFWKIKPESQRTPISSAFIYRGVNENNS